MTDLNQGKELTDDSVLRDLRQIAIEFRASGVLRGLAAINAAIREIEALRSSEAPSRRGEGELKALLRRAVSSHAVQRELGEWWVNDVSAALNKNTGRSERCPHGVSHLNRCKECD